MKLDKLLKLEEMVDFIMKAEKSLELSINSPPHVTINPEHGRKIADAYESAKHDPQHPEVRAAYNALVEETKKQYKDLLDMGFKFSKIRGDNSPYKTSSDMHEDVLNNKHLHWFPTDAGFGNGDNPYGDHPMLQPTEFKDEDGKPMTANCLFRQVHDINGHVLGGKTKFGAKGEHQAYLAHKKQYSPLAQKALAAETLMQNQWVNFSKDWGEHNRKNPDKTKFADQKAILTPDWVLNGKWHE